PGSRSKQGLVLPEPGAKGVDRTATPQVPLAKDKDAAAGVAAGERQNELAAQLASSTSTNLLASETARQGRPRDDTKFGQVPNPKGISVSLTAESFQKLVTATQHSWFIKFYAPWCPHCKELKPIWDQVAKEMAGKLNIGEVNCDAEPRLCKD